MVHAAEDAARFLHQACQGLPQRVNGHPAPGSVLAAAERSTDRFDARVIEHAVAYFGSRVLYPSRPAPESTELALTRAACDKAAQAALRDEAEKFECAGHGVGRHGTHLADMAFRRDGAGGDGGCAVQKIRMRNAADMPKLE